MTDLITVCDDWEKRVRGWQTAISDLLPSERFVVERYEEEEFLDDLRTLRARRAELRGRAADDDPFAKSTRFDRSAVLIVDYDLFDFAQEAESVTGDSVAYLARCFSTCGFIVGVNQDRVSNPFDLRLTGHPRSFVDLSIGDAQVTNPGLWSSEAEHWRPFRPWVWPDLTNRHQALAQRAQNLIGLLDAPLRDAVALPPEVWASLGRNVAEYLEVAGNTEPTLRQWTCHGGMGMDPKDQAADDASLARVAAARLMKWLEWLLLPRQDVLVDAPHLIERRPGALAGDSRDPRSWDVVAQLGESATEHLLPELTQYRAATEWLSRPVWLWTQLSVDPELDHTRRADRPDPQLVFAEDASRFVPRETARRFVARSDSPFPTRWLGQVEDDKPVQYVHAVRLAMAT